MTVRGILRRFALNTMKFRVEGTPSELLIHSHEALALMIGPDHNTTQGRLKIRS